MKDMVQDFHDEAASLREVVAGLPDDRWLVATPAEGWDVRDQIAHLADTDEIAWKLVVGGERQLLEEAARYAEQYGHADGFTQHQVDKGRAMAPVAVLAWWDEAHEKLCDSLLALAPDDRVPWGPNRMSAKAFTTARLMETWAHGLDVRAALGVPSPDTDRLRHVAFIVYRALPHAFRMASRPMPEGELRVELVAPDGSTWDFGPPGAPHRITGTAGDFCRVGVQRMKRSAATSLVAEGELADAALDVARAFL